MTIQLEEILNLFDSNWFQNTIFTTKSVSQSNPDHEIHQEVQISNLSNFPTFQVKSQSDQILSPNTNLNPESLSQSNPDHEIHQEIQKSNLTNFPKFDAKFQCDQILSSNTNVNPKSLFQPNPDHKIHQEIQKSNLSSFPQIFSSDSLSPNTMVRKKMTERKRRKKGCSKSLSELEFEEVKGFMDLGFVFSKEDKDSMLVAIIPGLHRLGEKNEENGEEIVVSRPYLSESWNSPLLNWRIPSLGNDLVMKHNLRFWAHIVASTVK